MSASIMVADLGKRYRIFEDRPTTFKEAFLSGRLRSTTRYRWGLRHINFTVRTGVTVGVVGKNGAGKSTLLRLIGGVGRPDEGTVRVRGRIGALLEIGAGLTDDLTGRENVFLTGVIAGMLRSELEERFDKILAFAELEHAIDSPVRTYSTGMRMRLAFSVAAHVQPDVLLIDEVLAVGDAAFQHKCLARINEIKESGCTIFLVSHEAGHIRALCDEVLFLKEGRMVAYGPTLESMALYESSIQQERLPATPKNSAALPPEHSSLQLNVNRFGSLRVELDSVRLLGADDVPTGRIPTQSALSVEFCYHVREAVEDPIALVGIYVGDAQPCFETNSQVAGMMLGTLSGSGIIRLRIDRLDLAAGDYQVTVGLFSSDWNELYDYHAEVYPLTLVGQEVRKGFLAPPTRWEFEPLEVALPRVEVMGAAGAERSE